MASMRRYSRGSFPKIITPTVPHSSSAKRKNEIEPIIIPPKIAKLIESNSVDNTFTSVMRSLTPVEVDDSYVEEFMITHDSHDVLILSYANLDIFAPTGIGEGFIVAKNLGFSFIENVGRWPVIFTKVVGVTFRDGNKSRTESIHQLALASNKDTSKLIAELSWEKGNKFDPFAQMVYIGVKGKTTNEILLPLQKCGYLPKQLSRILTIFRHWYKIPYMAEVDSVKVPITTLSKLPPSIKLVLRPQVDPVLTRGPAVRTLSFGGKGIKSIRKMLEKSRT